MFISIKSFLPAFLLGVTLCFTACSGDKESHPEKDINSEKSLPEVKVEEPPKEVPQSKEPIFPRLSKSNSLEFLEQFGKENPENKVAISTPYGEMKIELFDDTPIHRANFIYLIKRDYFNPTEMVRVIKNFIIQGGNSEKQVSKSKRFIIGDYIMPAEFSKSHVHTKGALAMSRNYTNNPDKNSAVYDFYIVHGRKYQPVEVYNREQELGWKYSKKDERDYTTIGGALHLDYEHTVFGRVTSGFNVIDSIANVEVDGTDWPKKEISITVYLDE